MCFRMALTFSNMHFWFLNSNNCSGYSSWLAISWSFLGHLLFFYIIFRECGRVFIFCLSFFFFGGRGVLCSYTSGVGVGDSNQSLINLLLMSSLYSGWFEIYLWFSCWCNPCISVLHSLQLLTAQPHNQMADRVFFWQKFCHLEEILYAQRWRKCQSRLLGFPHLPMPFEYHPH